jgi:hypothetical protein
MGLIGEILFLRGTLKNRIGLSEALRSWTGQEMTRKDFSYNNTWTEVKTINSGKQTIRISSIEQLDSSEVGELAVFAPEKMSGSYDGIKLNSLIVNTRKTTFHLMLPNRVQTPVRCSSPKQLNC